MKAYFSDINDFPKQMFNLREGKFLSPKHQDSYTKIELDNKILGHIVHRLKHLINAIYPDIENILLGK